MLHYFKNNCLFSVHVCPCVWVVMCHGTFVEVSGQLVGVGFLLPPCGLRRSNSGWLAWRQVTTSVKPSCRSHHFFLRFFPCSPNCPQTQGNSTTSAFLLLGMCSTMLFVRCWWSCMGHMHARQALYWLSHIPSPPISLKSFFDFVNIDTFNSQMHFILLSHRLFNSGSKFSINSSSQSMWMDLANLCGYVFPLLDWLNAIKFLDLLLHQQSNVEGFKTGF